MHGKFRAGPIADYQDPHLPGERIEFNGKRRGEVSGAHSQDVPDNTRGTKIYGGRGRKKF